MKYQLQCSDNCLVCDKIISDDWKKNLNMEECEFTQTWCKLCILKYSFSYPKNADKLQAMLQIDKLERINKKNNES
jgi:hypothetical protein